MSWKSPYWKSAPTIAVKNKNNKSHHTDKLNAIFEFQMKYFAFENSHKTKGLEEHISALLSLN